MTDDRPLLASLIAGIILGACTPVAGPAPDEAQRARFEAVCTESLAYGAPICACLAGTAASRFDAEAYSFLIDSMAGEPVRERMQAAGLNSSRQGAITRFVAETALSCQPES